MSKAAAIGPVPRLLDLLAGADSAPNEASLALVRDMGRSGGFLKVRHVELSVDQRGDRSPAFPYDVIDRVALDAAVMVPWFMKNGARHVVVRSALRPPLFLAGAAAPDLASGYLWELPAGLIEPGEAPIAAAARELNEEIGTNLGPDRVRPLGAATVPVPAMIAERQFFFSVEIDLAELTVASGDGSPLERVSKLATATVDELLELVRTGRLPDAKTELGLRRFAERPT